MRLRVSLLPAIAVLIVCPLFRLPAYELAIAHVADTHDRHEPHALAVAVRVDGRRHKVAARLGGLEVLGEAVRMLRRREPNLLFVHGGDFLPSKKHAYSRDQQRADTRAWNRLGLDAAALGNHEFDYGPRELRLGIVAEARYPLLSANTDFLAEPWLRDAGIKPYVIRRVGGEEVGIVGLTLTATPLMSKPGPNVVFLGALADAQRAVDELRGRGVNKVILLSHMGIEWDLAAAGKLSGVDVIVGAHTHLLLGRLGPLPWLSWGPYPIVRRDRAGDRVLLVHAYRGLEVLGCLRVRFDTEGRVRGWEGQPMALLAPAPDTADSPALEALAREQGLFVSGLTPSRELLLAGVSTDPDKL
jgi:5'-nucleotidase